MGLAIQAFTDLKLIVAKPPTAFTAGEHDTIAAEGGVVLYHAPAFEVRADGMAQGAYAVRGERFGFHAGSYSGYNEWRRLLVAFAEHVSRETNVEGFGSLIVFSDCEGTIGPKTSAAISRAFEAGAPLIGEWFPPEWAPSDNEEHNQLASETMNWWRAIYRDFAKAFALAADNGAVKFT